MSSPAEPQAGVVQQRIATLLGGLEDARGQAAYPQATLRYKKKTARVNIVPRVPAIVHADSSSVELRATGLSPVGEC